MRKLYLLLMGMLLIACPDLFAQLPINTTGTAVPENFDGMGSSATAALPTGFKIGPDWATGTTVVTKAAGTTGTGALASNSAGGVYNFADGVTATSTDRCLGFLNSSSVSTPQSIVLKITNNTGSNITSLTIRFNYEKYRTGTSSFNWTFFHGNTTNPTISATDGDQAYSSDLSPNAVVNPPTSISKTVNLTNLTIAPGTDYYLRWTFTGGPTNGQGIGIDNFSIAANATDATLSGLALSSGTLIPAFSSSTTSYTASVLNAVNSITVTPTTNASSATITVNTIPVTSGNASAPISLVDGPNTITTVVTAQDGVTTKTYTITVTRAVAGTPTVVQNSALSGFGNICINTTTGPNSFTIDGADLDGSNISLAALSGFTYSESPGGPYTSTLSFSYAGNSFTSKTIYVIFNPTVIQAYDGNIAVNGGGITPVNIPVTGSGINTTATVTTGASSAITPTTATIAGSITGTGCSPVTGYGLEYSIAPTFPVGTGTQMPASNLSGGNFSVALSGLTPNQRVYYHAYIITAAGTTYGAEQGFNAAPLPVPMASQPGMSYTQDFSDIASWTNFFINGNGANHFNGLSSTGTGATPNPNLLTFSTGTFITGVSGGVQKGTDQSPATQSIVLLSTGSTDNTSSAAIDFYMDFTGVNAGTLSFDWASVNNSTGDRNGSLRVYASIDGTTWTDLTFADVLNFTNNSPTSGSQSNIALPAIFNNSATARLRFYYYNATGGITPTGSRPKISIDNLKVTSVATTPCVSPTAAPTALTFGTITDVTIAGSFAAAIPASDNYLVIASTSSSLTSNPVDGQIYNIGDNVGDGTVIANGNSTSFNATGLNASTTYYFFIYSLNSICTGGPLYFPTPLTGQATTNAGLPPCAAPAAQPTALTFGATTPSSIQGSFTATTADEYLVLVSTSASLSSNPVNAQAYAAGDVIGNATVVSRSTATTFTANNLAPNTPYYFYVFSLQLQNCLNGPAYNTTSPLTASQNTQPLPPCATPMAQPTSLTFNASNTSISGTFTAGSGADDYLVIRSTTSTLSATPVDNTDYNVGDNLGGGVVVANTTTTSFLSTSLTPSTNYYFFVFATNKNCTGGTKYLTTAPLTGSQATSNIPVYNYYFGTLHSHSDYSDGNQDHPGYTPTDDYNYAITAQCMDFLGISEHNHFSSANNPGNQIANYHSGSVEANTFSAAHSNFLALYGMEWGVISGGGHVVVYGDGMDDLFGWESGSGGWGSSNNYDVYVAKSDYTGASGLFKTINDYVAKNTFATLAHPNSSDYNNLSNTTYNTVADNAITGSAVESGPATSTNTTYSNPASPMSYLSYFQKLLALGYHLGPVIDHDNHNTTFGHTTYSRTAVLAPSLTKTDIIKAYRDMHFYATQDCDSKVDFTINTHMIGSVFTDRNAPILTVNITDATTNVINAVINVMFGVPGSGVTAQKIATVTGSTLTYQDNNLADMTTGYYYIDITNGSARIITSPIWYTRNDNNAALPVSLLSFTGQQVNGVVKLSWTTAQETNSKEFIVERSTDGRNFSALGKVAAVGTTNHPTTYGYTDVQPVYGMNYYRLQQVDIDGKSVYSDIVRIKTDRSGGFYVGPNPARTTVTIYRQGNNEAARIELMNVNGQLVKQLTIAASTYSTSLNVSGLSKGIYLMKFTTSTGIHTQKIMVE